jgi:hypothetical protein
MHYTSTGTNLATYIVLNFLTPRFVVKHNSRQFTVENLRIFETEFEIGEGVVIRGQGDVVSIDLIKSREMVSLTLILTA